MFGTILLFGSMLAAQAESGAEDAMKLEVRRLVRQLDAPQLADRDAAQAKLIQMGSQILDLLPPVTDRTPAEVQTRLTSIRQQLQRALAESFAQVSTVTLHADAMPLSKVLAAIQEQTGNKIVDYRRRFGHEVTDPTLKVHFDKTPFWKALDQVLDQAELTVYPYGEERAVHVVRRSQGHPLRSGAASYSGPLRLEPLRILARRELRITDDSEGTALELLLEVAWEPRISPINLQQSMADLKAVDEKGNPLSLEGNRAELEVPVTGPGNAVRLPIPLALPPRTVQEIASLKGTLAAMLPGKTETFRFEGLREAKNVEKRLAGVTVTLEQVRKNNEAHEVRVRIRYDDAGQALESHRGWVLQNEAYLEDPEGKPIAYDSMETTRQTKNEIGIAYVFGNLPAGSKFVYKTPGLIVTSSFPYEIKGVKLP